MYQISIVSLCPFLFHTLKVHAYIRFAYISKHKCDFDMITASPDHSLCFYFLFYFILFIYLFFFFWGGGVVLFSDFTFQNNLKNILFLFTDESAIAQLPGLLLSIGSTLKMLDWTCCHGNHLSTVYIPNWDNLQGLCSKLGHDDVIKWKHSPHYWPFVLTQEIHCK